MLFIGVLYRQKNQYYYQIDAKTGDIIYGRRYILLAAAKRLPLMMPNAATGLPFWRKNW
ncbi:MAG: hypothetical protein L6V93_00435 [Clostridiales bacterium]|nr:MAG: hypothetical protein L6V93_00435 [Clostridiales bacterium]